MRKREDPPPRKFLNFKMDGRVMLVMVLAAAAFMMWGTPAARQRHSPTAAVAVATVDGREVFRLRLANAEDEILTLEDKIGVPVSFEVSDGRIRFVDVTCPDHICERTGFISNPGETAVCMPNKTVLSVQQAKDLPSR